MLPILQSPPPPSHQTQVEECTRAAVLAAPLVAPSYSRACTRSALHRHLSWPSSCPGGLRAPLVSVHCSWGEIHLHPWSDPRPLLDPLELCSGPTRPCQSSDPPRPSTRPDEGWVGQPLQAMSPSLLLPSSSRPLLTPAVLRWPCGDVFLFPTHMGAP